MWNWVKTLQTLSASGQPFAIVTVTRCSGSTPRETGAKMFVLNDGRFLGTIGGGALERRAIDDALRCLKEGRSQTLHFPLHAAVGQCCGGVVELLVEIMNQEPVFYLFGAGHVAQALAKTLVGTPFRVHVIDERPEWINSTMLPEECVRHGLDPREFIKTAAWDASQTYACIMTHDHELDRELLGEILKKPSHYLGLIGSRSKWQAFQNTLTKTGTTPDVLKKVRCPVGLNTGGKSPQEVAISIAAELLQVFYEK